MNGERTYWVDVSERSAVAGCRLCDWRCGVFSIEDAYEVLESHDHRVGKHRIRPIVTSTTLIGADTYDELEDRRRVFLDVMEEFPDMFPTEVLEEYPHVWTSRAQFFSDKAILRKRGFGK